jgi:phosphatidylserine/phosphatidylglycerophosphate/cardiolipin synthase-like enzyme
MRKTLISVLLLFLTNNTYSKTALQQINDISPLSEVNLPLPELELNKNREITELPFVLFSNNSDIDEYIKATIKSSKDSIDIAIYGLSNMEIAEEIVNAQKRGVNIRVIMNQTHIFNSKVDPSLKYLIDNRIQMKTLKGAGQYGIMHNKIAISDNRILLTGSYNWTMKANNNNYENIVFSSQAKYIKGYKDYFDWMWSYAKDISQGPMADYDSSILKYIPQDKNPDINFNGYTFPSYVFSPNGGIKATVINAIKESRKSIKISVFSLYDADIYKALLEAKNNGIEVKIITDRVQASQSNISKYLYENSFDFKWISGYNSSGVMHNKFAIFDENLLITGSFNFSESANSYNFENIFISNDLNYVKPYIEEFNLIYNQARTPTQEEINSINPKDGSNSN